MAYTARIHKGDAMKELMKELNSIKKYIPYNTFRTIKGQIKSGKIDLECGIHEALERLSSTGGLQR